MGPVQIQAFQLGTPLKDSGNVVESRAPQPQVAKFWETGQSGEALVGDRGARQIQPNQHWLQAAKQLQVLVIGGWSKQGKIDLQTIVPLGHSLHHRATIPQRRDGATNQRLLGFSRFQDAQRIESAFIGGLGRHPLDVFKTWAVRAFVDPSDDFLDLIGGNRIAFGRHGLVVVSRQQHALHQERTFTISRKHGPEILIPNRERRVDGFETKTTFLLSWPVAFNAVRLQNGLDVFDKFDFGGRGICFRIFEPRLRFFRHIDR